MLATVAPEHPGGAVGVAVVYYFSAVTKALALADGNVVSVWVSGCVGVWLYGCMGVCVCMCVYVCVYVFVCVYVCV